LGDRRPKKALGYLVDTSRSSQDNNKREKCKKQENQKIRTKVHQHWFSSRCSKRKHFCRCSNRKHKTIFCW